MPAVPSVFSGAQSVQVVACWSPVFSLPVVGCSPPFGQSRVALQGLEVLFCSGSLAASAILCFALFLGLTPYGKWAQGVGWEVLNHCSLFHLR